MHIYYNVKVMEDNDSLHVKEIQIRSDEHLFHSLIESKEDSLSARSNLDMLKNASKQWSELNT